MSDIYLDNSATTAVCPAACNKAIQMMTLTYANPSSLYSTGLRAEEELTSTRQTVADLIGARTDEIVFTSGGTEANNLAVLGAAAARRRRGTHVVVSAIEHSSVRAAFDRLEQEGFSVTRVAPRSDGRIEPDDVVAACRPDTVLVSVMLVNNETGARFPLEGAIAHIRRAAPLAAIHTDAVQAAGKIPVSVKKLDIDLLSMSAHKMYAPKGVGALYVRKGVRLIPPAALGGGQEHELRSGTENTPGIAAWGAAIRSLPPLAESERRERELRSHLLDRLAELPNIRLHLPENSVPYIVNFSVQGLRSETMIHFLANRHIFVSGGSACSRGHLSPVLTAMGLPTAEIDSALRISFGQANTLADVDALVDALTEAIGTLIHRQTGKGAVSRV